MDPTPSFWHGRRVLITGHTGFKGSWLSLWLTQLGARVTGFALEPDSSPNLFEAAACATHIDSRTGDVRDEAAVRTAVRDAQPSIVLHLAAQSLVRRSYHDPVGTYATNVMGTAHVLDAVRQADSVAAVVVVTSDKCYENREWVWAYREDDHLGGHDPYSSSKGAAEIVTSSWRRSFFASGDGPGVASARAGNVIGGGDWSEDRLVPDCVRAFERSEPVILRNPAAVRPWQHVLEPLSGYLLLAERLAADPGRYAEAWNFGPAVDEARPVSWMVDRLARTWGDGARWERDPTAQPHEAGLLQVDSSKARARLGWAPRLSLHAGLDWTVEWYRRVGSGADASSTTLEQIERYGRCEGEARDGRALDGR